MCPRVRLRSGGLCLRWKESEGEVEEGAQLLLMRKGECAWAGWMSEGRWRDAGWSGDSEIDRGRVMRRLEAASFPFCRRKLIERHQDHALTRLLDLFWWVRQESGAANRWRGRQPPARASSCARQRTIGSSKITACIGAAAPFLSSKGVTMRCWGVRKGTQTRRLERATRNRGAVTDLRRGNKDSRDAIVNKLRVCHCVLIDVLPPARSEVHEASFHFDAPLARTLQTVFV